MAAENDAPETPLHVANAADLRTELALKSAEAIQIHAGEDQDLDRKADHFVGLLLEDAAQGEVAQRSGRSAVETMAADLQQKAAVQVDRLKQPVKQLATRGAEGGDVANALINLKMEVEALDPGKFDFEPGWLSRTLGKLPGVGTPIKRYFSKYESAQTVIAAIVRSLEQGRDQLQRDNITLGEDQKQMRAMIGKLEQAIQLGQLIDQKLQYRLEREIPAGDPRHAFISEELVFPLRQRLIDLQQQLAVHQQGVLATELIIRNNQELSRGVNRALNVTVTALQVAATVALALANQKIVLDKIEAVNKTTSDIIAGTAARLRTQGVQIQKQATSAQLDMNSLRAAFADINGAIDDLASFRMKALPQMAETVLELDKVTGEANKALQKLDQGRQRQPAITIDAEAQLGE
jgi:Uncharacterized protein involved in tellurite resistance